MTIRSNKLNNLKRYALLPLLGLFLVACSNVGTGQVGVKTGASGKINQCGVGAGTHWTGFGDMHKYTTRLQYSYMTADPKEGDRNIADDVRVSSKEGAGLSVDLQIGYILQGNPDIICRVYRTLAKDDAQVKDNIIRPTVRAVAPDIFAAYSAKDSKTTKRGEVADKVREALNNRFKQEPFTGFVLVQSVQIGDVRLPDNIQGKVNDAINAEADNVTAELQRKAELTRAETARQAADFNRQTSEINAAAQANANRQIAGSLTPDLANLKAIEACANALAQTHAQVVSCGGSSAGNVLITPGK